MSGVAVTVKALRAMNLAYFRPVEKRVHGIVVPQWATPPYVLVNLVYDPPEMTLKGQTGTFVSRVSLEVVGATADGNDDAPVQMMAAAGEIIAGLDALSRSVVGDAFVAQFWKQGTDITDASDVGLLPRRVMDYTVRWRRLRS